jgi:hypothetical protein
LFTNGDLLIQTAYSVFYADRRWDYLLRLASLDPGQADAFRDWLPTGRVDQKRTDAVAMLKQMRNDLGSRNGKVTSAPSEFTPTALWNETIRRETPVANILEEFLLVVPLATAVCWRRRARRLRRAG